MKYIYALDLALGSTGVAIFNDDGQHVWLQTIDTKKVKSVPLKLVHIANELLKLEDDFAPKIIIIERGFSRFNRSTQQIFRVHGVVNYIFANYPQIYIPPATVKKVVGGKGNINKDDLRKIINMEYPAIKFKNNDESDAMAVGLAYFIQERILS